MGKAVQIFGKGRAFTIAEHKAMAAWTKRPSEEWLRIEISLSFPDTPEMLSITEPGTKTPSFLMWRTDDRVIVYPFFTARYVRDYATISDALDALASWWIARRTGEDSPLPNCRKCSGGG